MATRTQYGYAESTNLRATNAGPVRSGVCAGMALENGMLMKAGPLVEGEKEIYTLTKPTDKQKVVLVLSALIAYDTSTTLGQHEMYLRKEDGEAARFYGLEDGELGNTDIGYDVFSVASYTVEALATIPVVGNYVVANPDKYDSHIFYKEVASGEDMSAYGFVALVEDIIYQSNLTKIVLRVVKNIDVQ